MMVIYDGAGEMAAVARGKEQSILLFIKTLALSLLLTALGGRGGEFTGYNRAWTL